MIGPTWHALGQELRARTWRKMIAVLSASPALWLFMLSAGPAAGAELSLRCFYDVITGTQAAMTLCGERLDHRDQAAYGDLVEALKKYINENARSEGQKISRDHDEKLRQHREMRVRQGFCSHPDYVWFKERLLTILRTQEREKISKRLEAPGNPSEGGCF